MQGTTLVCGSGHAWKSLIPIVVVGRNAVDVGVGKTFTVRIKHNSTLELNRIHEWQTTIMNLHSHSWSLPMFT